MELWPQHDPETMDLFLEWLAVQFARLIDWLFGPQDLGLRVS